MAQSINYLALILNMNSRLFINSLEGVTDQQAKERISDHSNPLCWLAGHTVSSRYLMLLFLGKPAADPYKAMFENFKGYDATITYPTLAEAKAEWEKVTALLTEALASVSEEILAAEAPFKNPTGDFSNAGTLAFVTQHESYDIGQMAFLKKYYTKEAMKY
jgi:hypothetical protein